MNGIEDGTRVAGKAACGAAVEKDAIPGGRIDGDGGAEDKGDEAAVSAAAPSRGAEGDKAEAVAVAPPVSGLAAPRETEDGTGGVTGAENWLAVKGFFPASDDSSDEPDGEPEIDRAFLTDVASVNDNNDGAEGGENDLNGPAVLVGSVGFTAELVGLEGVCACVETFQAWGVMLLMLDFWDREDIALANVKLTGALAPLGLGSGAIIGNKLDGRQRRRLREQWKKWGLKEARVMLRNSGGDGTRALIYDRG